MQRADMKRNIFSLRGMLVSLVCLALTGAVLPSAARATSIDGPRPAGHVVDDVGVLGAEDAERIERLAAGVRQTSGADMVVVAIATTNGRPHRAFATELFNRWQLGLAQRNDGLLILVAIDDRKAEIILGTGIDAPEQVAASERIMSQVMVPEFRQGRPATAIRNGAFACATEILGLAVERPLNDAPAVGPNTGLDPRPGPRLRQAEQPAGAAGMLPVAIFGGGSVGGACLTWYLARRHGRNRPRTCPICRIDMVRLGETAEDSRLADGERTEERIGSVEYDVWTCPTCPHVTKVRYGAFFTAYSRCPACGYATKSETVNRIRSPTSFSSGLEEVVERCKNCGHSARSTRVIPVEQDDNSSMWSSSSSCSSSSSGGHSSGSGASGSW